jgi:hypothetical protein
MKSRGYEDCRELPPAESMRLINVWAEAMCGICYRYDNNGWLRTDAAMQRA